MMMLGHSLEMIDTPDRRSQMTVLGQGASEKAGATMRAFDRLEWGMLGLGSVLSGFACTWIAGLFGIPREPHFSASLLLGGAPITAVVVAIIAIGFSMLIGSLTAWFVEREAGLFCCCLGIAALGVRCGGIRPVLQYAFGPAIFIVLALEAIVLSAILIGGWIGIRRVLDRVSFQKAASTRFVVPTEKTDATLQEKFSTLGVHMLAMAIVELILIQTDAKAQAMAGVFIAAYVGALAAYTFTPLVESIWYWAAPMAVAFISYIVAYFSGGATSTGDLQGWTAGLVRATPLDYAGMGTAGALLGYWSIRRWTQPDETTDEETAAA
jgi:small basic protein